jgi:hypothetical protein
MSLREKAKTSDQIFQMVVFERNLRRVVERWKCGNMTGLPHIRQRKRNFLISSNAFFTSASLSVENRFVPFTVR